MPVSCNEDPLVVKTEGGSVEQACLDGLEKISEAEKIDAAGVDVEGGNKNVEPSDIIANEEDLYHYTKRGEFTSEMFKVCVDNIPHFVNYQVRIFQGRITCTTTVNPACFVE